MPALFSVIVEPAIGVLGDTARRRVLILGGGVAFALALALTALSADPSRLLVATDCGQLGRETVTLTMKGQGPTVCAQALAGEGTVNVYVTSSEFEGEIAIPVILERAVLRWGLRRYEGGRYELASSGTMTAGSEKVSLVFALQSESGESTSSLRPGVEPPVLRLANSPEETRLIAALFGPRIGVDPQDMPGWSSLLLGPLVRGTEVTVK